MPATARAQLKPLDQMPQRSTDHSYCVDEVKYLRNVNVVKGELKLVKREKGIEKQYPLNCTLCDVTVAYRCVGRGCVSLAARSPGVSYATAAIMIVIL